MADLIVTSVNPDTAPENIIWCSDPKNVIKDAPTVGLPGDYFYSPMQLRGNWEEYDETICSVDPSAVVEQTKQRLVIYLNATESSICMRCEPTETGTVIIPCSTSLEDVRTYNVTSLVIETNFGDGIVSELFKKHLIQTKQNINIEEVTGKRPKRRPYY